MTVREEMFTECVRVLFYHHRYFQQVDFLEYTLGIDKFVLEQVYGRETLCSGKPDPKRLDIPMPK